MTGEGLVLSVVLVFLFVILPLYGFIKHKREQREGEKSEALFKTMFPELQPYFHPGNVLAYVRARLNREGSGVWDDPPGFFGVARAVLERTPKGERTLLQDGTGATVGEFLFDWGDRPPTIGMVRVGKGKFRVKHPPNKPQWVSYWHPDREFDWRGPKLWVFRSNVADKRISSSDQGTNWDSSSSSSSSTSSTAAIATAAAAGIVAAGGTFDGGGASAAWDGGASSSPGDSPSTTSTGY